jgi:chromosome segregation ATPase
MDKQDIDKASVALTGALAYFSPIARALGQAEEVFSVLSNAIKHKIAIEADVAGAQATLADTLARIETAKEQRTSAVNDLAQVRAQTAADIAQAKTDAKEAVKQIKVSADAAIEAHKVRRQQSEVESGAAIAEARRASEIVLKDLNTQKDELQAEVAALEEKLVDVRAQLKRFADSLVG